VCGITGILHLRDGSSQADILQNMTRALAHRGPDGSGTWTEGPCGLGHTRLAILDLSDAGAQPMHSLDDRFILVYNGEVYNFNELKAELEELGCRFVSRSDTEVVLNAYATWGGDYALSVSMACLPSPSGTSIRNTCFSLVTDMASSLCIIIMVRDYSFSVPNKKLS